MAEVLVSLSVLPLLTDHPDLLDSYDNDLEYFLEFIGFSDQRIVYNHVYHIPGYYYN